MFKNSLREGGRKYLRKEGKKIHKEESAETIHALQDLQYYLTPLINSSGFLL